MIADLLSASRILLGILFILIARNKYAVLLIIVVAGLTDILDGFIARKFGETKFGKIIDPLADRIFVLLVIISLILNYGLNILYAFLILSRDIMSSIILPIFYFIKSKKRVLKVRISGKMTTVFLFITFISIILEFYANIFIFVTIVISIFSALDYLIFNFPKA